MQEATTGGGVPTEQTLWAQPGTASHIWQTWSYSPSTGKPCRQGKQAVAHSSYTSPLPCLLWRKFWGQCFCTCHFPYNPNKGDRSCLAAKGYDSRKYWGRSTIGHWCYHRRRHLPFVSGFAIFLTKIWNKPQDKIFKNAFSAIMQKPRSVCYIWKTNGRI